MNQTEARYFIDSVLCLPVERGSYLDNKLDALATAIIHKLEEHNVDYAEGYDTGYEEGYQDGLDKYDGS